MAVNKVDLYVSQILEDLNSGLTWLKRDDIGYGSIQEKYNAKDQQIVMIRKHPALKDAETNITVFNIIDDTRNESTTTTLSTDRPKTDEYLERPLSPDTSSTISSGGNLPEHKESNGETSVTAEDELAAFVNL